jgi:hypothetical protein
VQGKFTEEETQIVRATIENYRLVGRSTFRCRIFLTPYLQRENMSEKQIENRIFVDKQRKGNTFWQELGRSYPIFVVVGI